MNKSVDALPPGWKTSKDQNGNQYYYNKELNVTQWSRPAPSGGAVASPKFPVLIGGTPLKSIGVDWITGRDLSLPLITESQLPPGSIPVAPGPPGSVYTNATPAIPVVAAPSALSVGPPSLGLDFKCLPGQKPVITNVAPGSPAHSAGLLQGDHMLSTTFLGKAFLGYGSHAISTIRTDITSLTYDQLSVLLRETWNSIINAGGKMRIQVERGQGASVQVLEKEFELEQAPVQHTPAAYSQQTIQSPAAPNTSSQGMPPQQPLIMGTNGRDPTIPLMPEGWKPPSQGMPLQQPLMQQAPAQYAPSAYLQQTVQSHAAPQQQAAVQYEQTVQSPAAPQQWQPQQYNHGRYATSPHLVVSSPLRYAGNPPSVALADRMVGLGLALERQNNGTTVQEIVPGFAGHNSNQLQVGEPEINRVPRHNLNQVF